MVDQFFNIDIMRQAFPFLLKGLGVTLLLTAVLAPLGIILGLVLAIASNAQNKVLRVVVRSSVNVFRAFPPLVLIIFIFSALPFLGLRLPALLAVAVALLVNCGAYYCEILRAGLNSVPAGQIEAARSTGLGAFQTLRHITLPQAVRNVLPDLSSNTIEVVKATSLASIIGVNELLYMAGVARSVTYNASPIVLASIMYLVVLLPAVRLAGRIGQRPA